MKLLLVRHGESTGNRDHIWAGITDNELTNHGFQQATRLASYLQAQFSRQGDLNAQSVQAVYCSDLLRAERTASVIATALGKEAVSSSLLREQDLGWREGKSFKDGDKTAANNRSLMIAKPGESKDDMDQRAKDFIQKFLMLPFTQDHNIAQEESPPRLQPKLEIVVIVVSHGLFLLRLYYQLTKHLAISLAPSPSWSNTGCTTIKIAANGATVTDVNSVEHLQGLKRTRGGVGSSQYDTKQQKVSDFFRTKRRDSGNVQEEKTLGVLRRSVREIPIEPQVDTCLQDGSAEDDDLEAQIRAIDAACDR